MRLEALNRELTHRRQQGEAEERSRRTISERLAQYDDDEIADRGKDLFFSDRYVYSPESLLIPRPRWRNNRQQFRNREYQEDVRDRQAEQDEIKALEKESEDFIKKQMEEMERMEVEQKQRGLLTEDAAPIKLDLNVRPPTAPADVKPAAPVPSAAPSRPAPVAFEEDDDEEVAADKRKHRTFVKLEYDESALAKMTDAERAAITNAQLLDVRKQIPRDKRTLWGLSLDWDAINEVRQIHHSLLCPRYRVLTCQRTTKVKILSFVNSKLEEYLGEVDKDLADYVMENISERSKPDTMVDGLEPVSPLIYTLEV